MIKLKNLLPSPIQKLIHKTDLHKIRYLLKNKYRSELDFQLELVKQIDDKLNMVHNHWIKHRSLSEIIKLCGITKSTRILDVGCGFVSVLHFLEGKKYAIDPLAEEYAKHNVFDEICLQVGFGEFIPFLKNFFDVVFCTNALDHTSDPTKVISEMLRVLKPKGFLVVVVEVFDKKIRRDPGHPHAFTVSSAKSLVVDCNIIFEKISIWNPTELTERKDLIMVIKK